MLDSDSIRSGPPRPPVSDSASMASMAERSSGAMKASRGGIAQDKSRSKDFAATCLTKVGSTYTCRQSLVPRQLTSATSPAGTSAIESHGGGEFLFTPGHLMFIPLGGLVNRTRICCDFAPIRISSVPTARWRDTCNPNGPKFRSLVSGPPGERSRCELIVAPLLDCRGRRSLATPWFSFILGTDN